MVRPSGHQDDGPEGTSRASSLPIMHSAYVPATGRLDSTVDINSIYHFAYDSAGNTAFQYQSFGPSSVTDRVSYYGADNVLRAAESRGAWISGGGQWSYARWQLSFEEYRYDALGRRVLVMDRRRCWLNTSDSAGRSYCNLSRVRRTVWDGSRELWEIQMPAHSLDDVSLIENDTLAISYWAGFATDPYDQNTWLDPNPLFGRVAYTYAGGIDHPAMITRLQLLRRKSGDGGAIALPPLEVTPLWNWRGQADVGTFQNGQRVTCADTHHCIWPAWRELDFHFGYAGDQWGAGNDTSVAWFGTLIVGKEDGSGTRYSRNRYIDPISGRFTQEDPAGLAGGLNLYGFAAGDPVNFSDPFGLCPPCEMLDPAGSLLLLKLWTPDAINRGMVAELDQGMRAQANLALNLSWLSGAPVRVTEAYRTNETQDRYYAQGRTAPGPIITNARGGESPHNARKAMDVYPVVNGSAAVNTPAGDPVWDRIGAAGKAAGLNWGGDWPRFKDKPHFEQPNWKDN